MTSPASPVPVAPAANRTPTTGAIPAGAVMLADGVGRVLTVVGATGWLTDGGTGWIGRSLADVFPDVIAGTTPTMTDGFVRTGVRDGSGAMHEAEVALLPLDPPQGEASWLALLHDPRPRDFDESRRRESMKMSAVADLASRVANDFNNKLTAISGNLEAAWAASLREGGRGLREVASAREATRAAARIVRRLSHLAAPMPSDRRVIDPRTLVERALEAVRDECHPAVNVSTDLGHERWMVRADADQIGDILVNMFQNAREAMPRGGTLTVSTHRAVAPRWEEAATGQDDPREYVRIDIQDTGRGIQPDVLPRIFEPLFTTKDPRHGAGLGLSAVYRVLSQHAGGVTVESTVDVGTLFRIFLPRAHPPERTDDGGPRSPDAQATVLIIDDETAVRRPTRKALEYAGYVVVEAGDGEQGLSCYDEQADAIGLVILDIVMPGMSGWEVLEALRHRDPNLPVVLVSGYVGTGEPPAGIEPDAFLRKPYELTDLTATVRELLSPPPAPEA